MKLYFYFSVHEPLFHEVAVRLRERHGLNDIGGFVWGHDQRAFLEQKGFPWQRLDVFTDWLDELPAEADLGYLEQVEARYGIPNLGLMVFSERHLLRGRGFDDVLRLVEVAARRIERLLDEARPEAIHFESVDSLVVYLLHRMAAARGIRCIQIDTARIANRGTVTHTALQLWDEVDARFAEQVHRPLSPASRAAAEDFLRSFRSERPRVVRPGRFSFPSPRWDDLQNLLHLARRWQQDPRNPILRSPSSVVGQKAVRLARHWATRFGVFDQPVPGEKYVLFPLHYQPEASTLVLAPYYLDQLALIEDIAKSLPVGYRLYVKEHFWSLGRRPLGEYRRIRRIWNARLVDPLASPLDLVERSAGVATISGTMGWEAILLERPALTFGECFYNTFPLVVRAGFAPKAQWPQLFKTAITDFKPNRELLLKYIASILENTYEGTFWMDNPRIDARTMQRDNVDNLASVLAVEIGLVDRGRLQLAGGAARSTPHAQGPPT